MKKKKPIIALLYDFDKTLSTMDMQNYTLIPRLGLSTDDFWARASEYTNKYGMERTLSYMYAMIAVAKEHNVKLTKKFLRECGKDIEFYPGVLNWFKRINDYAAKKGITVEHYLISSGTKEIVEGSPIAKEFKEIYGCEFYFENGVAVWPKFVINFTQKTQYYYRVAKGATNPVDDDGVNKKSETHRIPYRNILYLGDGITDIACMTVVKKNDGHSIAIYPEGKSNNVKQILLDNRCNFIVKGDYRANSDLDKVVKNVIDKIAIIEDIEAQQKILAEK
ncbi:MAG: haloacid dehalogenase-like hydrolase [Bacilli bacterium]|nr:haloacid dehalogenase-like hydrolase [Bacilli bacterium]